MTDVERDAYIMRIISGIAHEIRNPLQGIIASLAAISWRLDNDPSAQPFLQMIQHEVSRINSMIDDMLIMRQSITMDEHPHDLNRLLEDAVRNLTQEAKARNANVELNLPAEPTTLVADGHRLSRAIEAILKNALESKEDPARVVVDYSRTEPNQCMISVRDDGGGIAPENAERVFEPFFTTKHKRMGLGLFIADRVVRAHEGKIVIQPNSGSGTDVRIYLPVLK